MAEDLSAETLSFAPAHELYEEIDSVLEALCDVVLFFEKQLDAMNRRYEKEIAALSNAGGLNE